MALSSLLTGSLTRVDILPALKREAFSSALRNSYHGCKYDFAIQFYSVCGVIFYADSPVTHELSHPVIFVFSSEFCH